MKIKVSQARKILATWTPDKLKDKGYKVCPRCGGTGNHSYNPMYGSTCFKCNGLGYIKFETHHDS